MQPTIAERIEHISTAIANIRQFTTGQTRESFERDIIVRLAIERLLEVISEASRHIPAATKSQDPHIDWRRLADLGNHLRHAYHETDAGLLWAMIENDLGPLARFIERIAKELNR